MNNPNLYLIAHKVRGELAFDVATPLEMPDGRWWIIPTSGHRAYPFWFTNLNFLEDSTWLIPPMPEDLKDHYTTSEQAQRPPRDQIPNLEDI